MFEAERRYCLENVGREQHVAGERNREPNMLQLGLGKGKASQQGRGGWRDAWLLRGCHDRPGCSLLHALVTDTLARPIAGHGTQSGDAYCMVRPPPGPHPGRCRLPRPPPWQL